MGNVFYLIFGISLYFQKLEELYCLFFSMIVIFLISKNLFFLEFFYGVIIGYIYFKFKINHLIALINFDYWYNFIVTIY